MVVSRVTSRIRCCVGTLLNQIIERSILFAAAPSSATFSLGRAIAGVGATGIYQGALFVVELIVPLEKRALYLGVVVSSFIFLCNLLWHNHRGRTYIWWQLEMVLLDVNSRYLSWPNPRTTHRLENCPLEVSIRFSASSFFDWAAWKTKTDSSRLRPRWNKWIFSARHSSLLPFVACYWHCNWVGRNFPEGLQKSSGCSLAPDHFWSYSLPATKAGGNQHYTTPNTATTICFDGKLLYLLCQHVQLHSESFKCQADFFSFVAVDWSR